MCLAVTGPAMGLPYPITWHAAMDALYGILNLCGGDDDDDDENGSEVTSDFAVSEALWPLTVSFSDSLRECLSIPLAPKKIAPRYLFPEKPSTVDILRNVDHVRPCSRILRTYGNCGIISSP